MEKTVIEYLEELKIKNEESVGAIRRLNIIEKSLNAFEVIKEKEVNVRDFKDACLKLPYLQYALMRRDAGFMGIWMTSKETLTEEEYNLLKEVLM